MGLGIDEEIKMKTDGFAPEATGVEIHGGESRGEAAQEEAAQGKLACGEAAQEEAIQGELAYGEATQEEAPQGEADQRELACGEATQEEAPQGEAPQGEAAQGVVACGENAHREGTYEQESPSGTAWKDNEIEGAIPSYIRPGVPQNPQWNRNPQPPCGNVQSPQPPYGNVQSPQPPYGNVQNPQPPYGNVQNPQPPYGNVQNPQPPYGNVQSPQPPYGNPQNPQWNRSPQPPYGNPQNSQWNRNPQPPYGNIQNPQYQQNLYRQISPVYQGNSQQMYQNPQPPFQNYAVYHANVNRKKDGYALGLTSMICGILSVFLFAACINYILAIVAIVLGIIQMVTREQKAFAIVGIVTSIFSVVAATILWVFFGSVFGELLDSDYLDEGRYYEDYRYSDPYDEDEYDFLNDYFEEKGSNAVGLSIQQD